MAKYILKKLNQEKQVDTEDARKALEARGFSVVPSDRDIQQSADDQQETEERVAADRRAAEEKLAKEQAAAEKKAAAEAKAAEKKAAEAAKASKQDPAAGETQVESGHDL